MPNNAPLQQPDITSRVLARRSPERLVGGFTRRDSTFLFYSLVASVLEPHFHVLDLGAGRGAQAEGVSPYKRALLNLKGRVARVVGADVDPAVMDNPMLDQAVVMTVGTPLPFPDHSFDVIISDWVLEHVDDPASFVTEVTRLLKPGGWFMARTPNRYGLIAIAASVIPNRLHTRVLSRLQPDRKEIDVFPTRYRMNTRSAINRWFGKDHYENHSTTLDTEVMYLTRLPLLFAVVDRLSRLLPSGLRPILLVLVRRQS